MFLKKKPHFLDMRSFHSFSSVWKLLSYAHCSLYPLPWSCVYTPLVLEIRRMETQIPNPFGCISGGCTFSASSCFLLQAAALIQKWVILFTSELSPVLFYPFQLFSILVNLFKLKSQSKFKELHSVTWTTQPFFSAHSIPQSLSQNPGCHLWLLLLHPPRCYTEL